MRVVACNGLSRNRRTAVVLKKETGNGREIDEEKFDCGRQAFIQNFQDETIFVFPEPNNESDFSFGKTQSR